MAPTQTHATAPLAADSDPGGEEKADAWWHDTPVPIWAIASMATVLITHWIAIAVIAFGA